MPEEDAANQMKESTIKCSKVKKLLWTNVDYKLKFDIHVEIICKNRKLNALSKIKKAYSYEFIFIAQFNCCPVI